MCTCVDWYTFRFCNKTCDPNLFGTQVVSVYWYFNFLFGAFLRYKCNKSIYVFRKITKCNKCVYAKYTVDNAKYTVDNAKCTVDNAKYTVDNVYYLLISMVYHIWLLFNFLQVYVQFMFLWCIRKIKIF
jgi:hypothetical protein